MTFDEVAAIIQSGDSDMLREIIQGIPAERRWRNINTVKNESSQTLLMVACESGFIECARVLLDHHADVNAVSGMEYHVLGNFWQSVLTSACLSGNADMLRFIVDRGVTIDDQYLLKIFKISRIVANTEIAVILVENTKFPFQFVSPKIRPVFRSRFWRSKMK